MRIDTYHTKGYGQWTLNIGSTQWTIYRTCNFRWYRVKPLFRIRNTTQPSVTLVLSFFGLTFFWGIDNSYLQDSPNGE